MSKRDNPVWSRSEPRSVERPLTPAARYAKFTEADFMRALERVTADEGVELLKKAGVLTRDGKLSHFYTK